MKTGLWRSATGTGRPKTNQSIRGRISNPIPILNVAEGEIHSEEHAPALPASRSPDAGDATSQRAPRSPPRRQHTATPPSSLSYNGIVPASGNGSAVAHSNNSGSNNSLPTAGPAGSPGPSPASDSARPPGTNRSSQIRYSAITASSQRTGDTGNKEAPQRKKSTIRGALSKLFGRRKKARSQGSTDPGHSSGTSFQHTGDTPAPNKVGKDVERKRSASLPITEYDKALRSHSVGPGDMSAIDGVHNSFHPDFHFARRRAATTSTQLYPAIQVKDDELAGLSPRPASSHARSSKILDDPSEIGRAITNEPGGRRRRSRSLSGIEGIGVARHGVARRRSHEIRYWRESYAPGLTSPLSSTVPEVDGTRVENDDIALDGAPTEGRKSPPKPFNFGSVATMNAMAGMKITQAASLDTRLRDLESRISRMEGVVNRLYNAIPEPRPQAFGREPAQRMPTASGSTLAYMGSAAAPDPSIYRTESQDGTTSLAYSSSRPSEETQSSFGEAPMSNGSLHPPPGARPREARPSSNSTIRGAASLPTLSREVAGPFTVDHYTTLLALLETERSTRRTLEVQVRKLTHAVSVLTKQSGADVLLHPPPTARSFGGQSVFDDDTTDDESEGVTPRRSLRSDDSGVAPTQGDTDDDKLLETYETPREERTLGFGAFGEELREEDDDGNRKRAARTLSLSQLAAAQEQRQL